ncbi:MAG TPA: hypothetical protein VFQ53_04250 [Kofleriaceae bacterium]|nr:hypothetical protein [Kofleriaceae bacterium]
MRMMICTGAIVLGVQLLAACESEKAGIEAAQKEAEAELKRKVEKGEPPKTIKPPVPGEAKIPCTQLIDTAAFQTALGEKEPLTVTDAIKNEGGAASSCDLVRGGKKLSDTEQKALLKKEGRLGVLPGDVICNVSAYCYTIETEEKHKARCKEKKEKDDESMGSYACVQIVAQGIDDVPVFRFFDADTKCILQVRGGPSNVNSDVIRTCAKTARDTIGPAQIAVSGDGAPAPAPAGDKAGSGSGS